MSATSFVLDVSVSAAWLLPDEATPKTRQLFARLRAQAVDVHAPELWLWESGNVIANAVKRSRMTADDAMLTWSVLDAARTRIELASLEPPQVRACLMLAIEDALSIYDAAYLWLAMSLRLPLMTLDRKLAAAAGARGVVVITPEDIE